MPKQDGKIPTLHIKEDSIPEAYYEAIKAVHEKGYSLRTDYDRKDGDKFIDPPAKDAKVMIEVTDPFAEPRYPILSYMERGKYIAEFLGAKDHMVVPYKELLEMITVGEEFEPTQWPYSYHQRLTAYPYADGSTIDQLAVITNKLAKSPITRRAVAITGVPGIDLFMKEDQPCLREIQIRALEDKLGRLVLNTHARWRSRDLYKAWGDNMIGITNLIQIRIVPRLAALTKKEIIIGPYTEENGSLHIYGQDYTEKGMDVFFEQFPTKESFVERSWTSEKAMGAEIIPQLKELRTETTWNFPQKSMDLIDKLIEGYKSGEFKP